MSQPDVEWMLNAECRQADPEIFYGQYKERPPDRNRRLASARRVCGLCAVADECLAYAVATDQEDGIWGGMTRRERVRYVNDGEDGVPLRKRACPCGEMFMPRHKKQNYCCGRCRKHAEGVRRWLLKKAAAQHNTRVAG
jgi:WhiB family redox-sensing transcriptional regulator